MGETEESGEQPDPKSRRCLNLKNLLQCLVICKSPAPRRSGGVPAFTPKLNYQQNVSPIPDLRPSLDHTGNNKQPFHSGTQNDHRSGGRRSRFNSGNSNGNDSSPHESFQRQSSGRTSLKERNKQLSDHEQFDSGRSSSRGKCVDDSGTDDDSSRTRRSADVGTGGGGGVGGGGSNSNNVDDDEGFVVHKRKAIPTLAQRISRLQSSAGGGGGGGNRIDDDVQSAAATLDSSRAAGKPSDRPAAGGGGGGSGGTIRSRRNSFSEESQLTWENFGGSTDNLHLLSRNPDKELGQTTSGRAAVDARADARAAAAAIRRKNSDLQSTIELGDGLVQDDEDALANRRRRRRSSSSGFGGESPLVQQQQPQQYPPTEYQQHHHRHLSKSPSPMDDSDVEQPPPPSPHMRDLTASGSRPVSFADLPTSQSTININFMRQPSTGSGSGTSTKKVVVPPRKPMSNMTSAPPSVAAEITNVRLQLEENKRKIEAEKRKVEAGVALRKQHVGKQAFMHALHKWLVTNKLPLVIFKFINNNNNGDDDDDDDDDDERTGVYLICLWNRLNRCF
ncbi:unnamed protein product [Notodromas monacha]|uniref:Uncharacterized protein n=1 Tax=Notodromas monacha TaxID=399045 RepID=A0A7R9GC26_9CRUS|nr:unnamed protein product [Notodromas monacha]CAG0915653.1 unnamed protein product [Notodromas monacha]